MPFIVHDVEQRSPEWHALRAGRVTGSCANAIIAERKRGTGELKKRAELRQRLVVERLTGIPQEKSGRSSSMVHGLETEPDAVAAYEAHAGLIVSRVGFISHPSMQAGCSPDGYIGEWSGAIEAKCPDSTTHLEYLERGDVPDEYRGQLLHALWLTGVPWIDFVSYDPRFKDDSLRLFVKRLSRVESELAAYELALSLFLGEVDAAVAKLMDRKAA